MLLWVAGWFIVSGVLHHYPVIEWLSGSPALNLGWWRSRLPILTRIRNQKSVASCSTRLQHNSSLRTCHSQTRAPDMANMRVSNCPYGLALSVERKIEVSPFIGILLPLGLSLVFLFQRSSTYRYMEINLSICFMNNVFCKWEMILLICYQWKGFVIHFHWLVFVTIRCLQKAMPQLFGKRPEETGHDGRLPCVNDPDGPGLTTYRYTTSYQFT